VFEYYAFEETKTKSYFNFTLEKTDSAPYNLSATISEYGKLDLFDGAKSLDFNMTACNSSREVTWSSGLISDYWWSKMGSNISYPDPSLSIQFDSRSANLTLDGYISARSPNLYGADTKIEAKIKVTFWGVNDASRSDLLKNDSSTPTWIRTIGFGNSTNDIQSLGKNSGSSNRESPSVLSLLASASALFFVSIYI
jgi:hypothetical protein